jgi:ribose transport system ATP-binding protein
MTGSTPAPLLRMAGIQKSFPGVQAVKEGRLELSAGQVLALLGENGAGKSTLVKVLSGAYRPEAGRILWNGAEVRFSSPLEARQAGIAVIYQELNLVPSLTVRENLFLGRERSRAGFCPLGRERAEVAHWLGLLASDINSEALVRDLTVAQQQIVEIAKALAQQARLIVMDEPTAALTGREVETLFGIIRELKARGTAVIYVSHRLDEIFAICDRATIMRDGEHVASLPVASLTRERLIELMVGRKLEAEFPRRQPRIGEERLVARHLQREPAVAGVSLAVRRGEIVGLAGLVGAGRTELARLLFGADSMDAGSVSLDGRLLRLRSPRQAIREGICLLTEDRKSQGLVLSLSARENFALPNLPRLARLGFVARRREERAFDRYVRSLRIKMSHAEQRARNLSGGNQQKVVLAKWLEANSEVVIFDEPTRGIDVGAKYEIYQLMHRLAEGGKAILMISSELPEILGMSDRILVMRAGRVTGEIRDVDRATQEQIMALAT